MKTFVTLFPDAENVHLVKDVGQIPFMMQKYFGYKASLVAYQNSRDYSHLNDAVKGFQLTFFKRGLDLRWFNTGVMCYLFLHARKIDVLNLYHLSLASKLYSCWYKMLNPSGIVYIKLDVNEKLLLQSLRIPRYAKRARLLGLVDAIFGKCVNILSLEARGALDTFKEIYPELSEKVLLIPNGIDADYFSSIMPPLEFDQKSNLIIAVGRIGAPEKNVESLVEAFAAVPEPGSWKLQLIGPCTDSFRRWFDEFVEGNPHIKGRVGLTEQSASRADLLHWYAQAKIFALSSRSEGFPLVYAEAAFFGNVVVSTDVGGSSDITDGGRLGRIVPVEDTRALAEAIGALIRDESFLRQASAEMQLLSAKSFVWSSALTRLDGKLRSYV